jgi:MFS family permease
MSIYFSVAFLGMTIGQYLYGVIPLDNARVIRLSALFFLAASIFLSMASGYAPAAITRARRATKRENIRFRVDKATLFILATAFAAGFSSGLLREFLYIYLGEVYNLAREDLASILAAAGIVSFIFGLAVGPLADMFGVHHVLALVLAVGAVGGPLLSSTSLVVAFTGVVLLSTAVRSSLPLTRNAAFLGALASMVALSNTLNNIGQVVSPLIAGFLYEINVCTSVLGVINCKGSPYIIASMLMTAVLTMYATLRRELNRGKD